MSRLRPVTATGLHDLVAAVSTAFAAAQEAIQRRQFARMLRAAREAVHGEHLVVSVTGSSDAIDVCSLAPARMHELAELAVEFDCVGATIYTACGVRLGLRVVRRGASGRAHRARIALTGQSGTRVEFSLDGHVLRLAASEQRHPNGRDGLAGGPARPVYLLTAADTMRVAQLLRTGKDIRISSRPRCSRATRHRRLLALQDRGEWLRRSRGRRRARRCQRPPGAG